MREAEYAEELEEKEREIRELEAQMSACQREVRRLHGVCRELEKAREINRDWEINSLEDIFMRLGAENPFDEEGKHHLTKEGGRAYKDLRGILTAIKHITRVPIEVQEVFSELDTILCFTETERELFDLVLLLEQFDDYGWQGYHQVGGWTIAKGGYDLWFQISYRDEPVIECVDHYLSIVNGNGCDADAALRVIKERYSYLEISEANR